MAKQDFAAERFQTQILFCASVLILALGSIVTCGGTSHIIISWGMHYQGTYYSVEKELNLQISRLRELLIIQDPKDDRTSDRSAFFGGNRFQKPPMSYNVELILASEGLGPTEHQIKVYEKVSSLVFEGVRQLHDSRIAHVTVQQRRIRYTGLEPYYQHHREGEEGPRSNISLSHTAHQTASVSHNRSSSASRTSYRYILGSDFATGRIPIIDLLKEDTIDIVSGEGSRDASATKTVYVVLYIPAAATSTTTASAGGAVSNTSDKSIGYHVPLYIVDKVGDADKLHLQLQLLRRGAVLTSDDGKNNMKKEEAATANNQQQQEQQQQQVHNQQEQHQQQQQQQAHQKHEQQQQQQQHCSRSKVAPSGVLIGSGDAAAGSGLAISLAVLNFLRYNTASGDKANHYNSRHDIIKSSESSSSGSGSGEGSVVGSTVAGYSGYSSGCCASMSEEASAQSIMDTIIGPHLRKILNIPTRETNTSTDTTNKTTTTMMKTDSRAIPPRSGTGGSFLTDQDVSDIMRDRLPDMLFSTIKSLSAHRQLLAEYPEMMRMIIDLVPSLSTTDDTASKNSIRGKYERAVKLIGECTVILEEYCRRRQETSIPPGCENNDNSLLVNTSSDSKNNDNSHPTNNDSSHLNGKSNYYQYCGNPKKNLYAETTTAGSSTMSTSSDESYLSLLLNKAYSKAYTASALARGLSSAPTLLHQQNFPTEQLLAIFAPFWIPIVIPLLKGLVVELRIWRTSSRKMTVGVMN